MEGEGERKKGDKAAKDAERKGKELEAVREKAKKAKEDFSGMEEKAFEVRKIFGPSWLDVCGLGCAGELRRKKTSPPPWKGRPSRYVEDEAGGWSSAGQVWKENMRK